MSMPSFDFFRSGPATEVLRIESEPPGADARTAEGQSCRTPCELTVPATGEVAISFALQGYNPQTINVRAEAPAAASYAEASSPARMQPNPVYAELTPSVPSRQKKKSAPTKKNVAAKKAGPAPTAHPHRALRLHHRRAGPGQRLSFELSLAAAAAGAVAEAIHVEGRTDRSAAAGAGMDDLADIRQSHHIKGQRRPVLQWRTGCDSAGWASRRDREKVAMAQAVSEFEVRRPLIDPFARPITYLRVSVTDRCDFRCVYCMSENMNFLPKADLLTLEELDRLCSAFVARGVRKLRLTGGEPLVRRGIMTLVASLSRHLASGDLEELTLTTNGSQLPKYARELAELGVKRVNVSLDTLDPEKFRAITRWGELDKVLAGIDAAQDAGLPRQDQRRRAQGRQRGRDPGHDRMGAWPRHGTHA